MLEKDRLLSFRTYLKSCQELRVSHLFNKRRVNSLYLEPYGLIPDFSEEEARRKYRIRWYGDILKNDASQTWLEQKYNINDLSVKMSKPYKTDNNRNVRVDEIAYSPIVQVSYDREYFLINNQIRMTIDTEIKFTKRFDRLGGKGIGLNVVELKFMPGLLPDIKNWPLERERYSKYAHAVAVC